ncbi:uncharacterized protein TA14180 [Theileria annulata]|uniref:Uncharacterized protein n=1 Tax=Theileria annulata TaxID=5874 RepID=Q4UDD5_THEAN|nr:uncharacterized protein TA14180 [Theileria annulata]CAI74904.1 hypothetical protein TA14180 [Theileria annulata]|eukprot:XP_952636.1 hypothetical protein TA14180 [Theileria annulata]
MITNFTESYYITRNPYLSHYNLLNRKSEKLKHFIIKGIGNDSELIIGGDLEEVPSIVKQVQTEESKDFVDKCWDKGLSIPDSIDLLNGDSDKDNVSIVNNFFNETSPNSTDTVGLVDKVESASYEDFFSDDEDPMEVDFGLLSYSEILIILRIINEKINNSQRDIKPELIKKLKDNLNLADSDADAHLKNLYKMGDFFITLNKTVNREPLDLNWIPEFEGKIFRFLKEKGYTLSRVTWTDECVILLLKEKDIPDKEISNVHDSINSFIQNMARNEEFRGLSNIGLMVSGSD